MLESGDQLQERYEIIRFISRGGMGAVYAASDSRLGGRQVAVKEMDPANVARADQQWAVTAFEQEAQVLARLNHPGIARVTDFFTEKGMWYLVMEFVQGETLQAALQRHSAGFVEAQVLTWAAQLGAVLDYLHQQNPPIIFRDLKPGNIMIQNDGSLKLIDFGIARFFKPGQRQDTMMLGTPGYAAPEQYGRGQTDARSDVYSLAVVLHQLLTGYDPALTPMYLPPLSQLRPDVSEHVATAIGQALQTDPAHRFYSIREFAAALHISISGFIGTESLPEDQPVKRRIPVPIIVAAAAVLLIFALVFLVLRNNGTPATTAENDSTPVGPSTRLVTATPTVPRPLTLTRFYEETLDAQVALRLATQETATAAAATEAALFLTETAAAMPTATPTAIPTETATPTRRPTPTVTPTTFPTPCAIVVYSGFQTTWNNYQTQLGCALAAARTGTVVQENFQRGIMFWRESNDKIYVFYSGGTWSIHNDLWAESHAEFSCGIPESPPTPRRGFGKIWCADTTVQTGLGNATDFEYALGSTIQDFNGGTIWLTDAGQLFVLFSSNGTWR